MMKKKSTSFFYTFIHLQKHSPAAEKYLHTEDIALPIEGEKT